MAELVLVLLSWIGNNTDYTLSGTQPNVVLVDPYQLCERYGLKNFQQCQALDVRGIYDKQFTIYLRNDFNPDDIEDHARLLHELVHWVQWANGRNEVDDCMGKLEVEAYELQDTWRAQYGLQAKRDPFTMLMMEASCS